MEDNLMDIKTESEIKDLILELQSRLDKPEIIAIVYNPKREEGMRQEDTSFLKFLFEKTKYNYPLFILSGHGGDFTTGLLFPQIIKKHVKDYKTYVPRICGSALCYTLLKSRELLAGTNTLITQIDPIFSHEGLSYRAIKVMKDSKINDSVLKDLASQVFHLAEKHVTNLCSPPSLFKYEVMAYNEYQHSNSLAALFMNKDDHEKEITLKELIELEANINNISDKEIDTLGNNLVIKCQDFTIKKNVRVVFVSSIPIRLGGESEGVFISPLL